MLFSSPDGALCALVVSLSAYLPHQLCQREDLRSRQAECTSIDAGNVGPCPSDLFLRGQQADFDKPLAVVGEDECTKLK